VAKSTGTPTENSGYELNTDSVTGKGRPTPTRKEREAANLRPLVSSDRKAAGQASKAQVASERQRARIGLANGEEKYLPARDKGPQRRFIRDYVDARFSVGEILIPVMFVVIILTFLAGVGTMLTGNDWLSFLMSVGFVAAAALYVGVGASALVRSRASVAR